MKNTWSKGSQQMIWEFTEISCKIWRHMHEDIFWKESPWLSLETQRTTWLRKKILRTFMPEKTSENKSRREIGEKMNEEEGKKKKINERKELSWEDGSIFRKNLRKPCPSTLVYRGADPSTPSAPALLWQLNQIIRRCYNWIYPFWNIINDSSLRLPKFSKIFKVWNVVKTLIWWKLRT